jgi:DNA-binding NarL/FixJ family response regulator
VHDTVAPVMGERAVVADELALARLGVISVLHAQGVDVVAETHSGRELVSVATLERPDLVVVGRPADLTVAETVRRLSRIRPAPVVVALLAPGEEHDVAYLLALGARGVALRTGRAEDLAAVIGSGLKGEQHVVAALQPALASASGLRLTTPANDLLSAREREVLACLAQGHSNREIAATLSVTLATVKSHLVRVYAKLEASNRNEALRRAVALGLLS